MLHGDALRMGHIWSREPRTELQLVVRNRCPQDATVEATVETLAIGLGVRGAGVPGVECPYPERV